MLPLNTKVPRRVGFCVFQLYRGIGNVHKDDGVILFGFDLERKAVLCERDLQVFLCTAFSAGRNLKLGAFRLTPLCSIVPSFLLPAFRCSYSMSP